MNNVTIMKDNIKAKKRDNIAILNPIQTTERFVLNNDGSLERLAEDAEFPEGYVGVLNQTIISQYIEQNGVLKLVDEVPEGMKPYEFKRDFEIYTRC